jgi:hypothetical protein
MATETQINAVVDGIVAAFGGNVSLFTSWLTRSRLEQDLAILSSQERNLRSANSDSNIEFNADLTALLEAQAAKQAEIDAL